MDYLVDIIAKRIAGDIIWSKNPGASMRKWRETFQVSQGELAKEMGISQSVIADYERNRRQPGAEFLRNYIRALIEIDSRRDYKIVKELASAFNLSFPFVEDMRDFPRPVTVDEVVKAVDGIIPVGEVDPFTKIYGYLITDSIKTITALSGMEYYQLLALALGRVFVFTKVSSGRSPMVAIKLAPIKPKVIVLHRPINIDPLALRLAEVEKINLIISTKPSEEDLINGLKRLLSSLS
ncbi:MAG: helix-turn-helix domain-containing protein [Sulfolobaceae archaeon]|nr:helix-turn-helix domain-containing protein [Sulfolobaceae archaeon]